MQKVSARPRFAESFSGARFAGHAPPAPDPVRPRLGCGVRVRWSQVAGHRLPSPRRSFPDPTLVSATWSSPTAEPKEPGPRCSILGALPALPAYVGKGGLKPGCPVGPYLLPPLCPDAPLCLQQPQDEALGSLSHPGGQQCPHELSHLPGKPCGWGPSRRPARSAQSVGPAQPPAPPQVCPSHPAPPTRLCGSSLLASPSPLPAARLKGG